LSFDYLFYNILYILTIFAANFIWLVVQVYLLSLLRGGVCGYHCLIISPFYKY